MPQKPKRHPARARRIVGIIAGVAVAAAAVTLPPSLAGADDSAALLLSAGYDKLPAIPEGAKKFAVPFKKLPPGAKRATKGASEPGARRTLFESPASRVRIVGGTEVRAADFPSVVGIQTTFIGLDENDDEAWMVNTCTGTVLSAKRVLTAAHCSIDFPYGYTEVIAGRDNLATSGSGFVARVASTWTHPGFNYERLLNDPANAVPVDDVTVLNLKDALPAAYTPVALAAQGAADPAADTSATIVGYGITRRGAADSGTLRAAVVEIESDATCATEWAGQFDANRMMCAGLPPTTDTCNGDSGGPIFTGEAGARVQVGITDWGAEDCGTKLGVYEALNHYSGIIKQQIPYVGPDNLDWTGDGHSDLFGRLKSNGRLIIGSGSGLATGSLSGFSHFTYAGTANFSRYTKLFRVNNWAGDGRPSIFARDSAGRLFNFRSDGAGAFRGGAPLQIGTGWNMFTDIMVTNNWTGNGLPNLMGRTADGRLVIYNSDGRGGWSNPRGTQIGTGWNKFNTVLTPGSWLGDGKQSLIGRTPAGELWLYNSNGRGGWTNPRGTKIGTGWGAFSTFMSPGDWNGDNLIDLVGVVRSSGDLKMYATNGRGSWLSARGRIIDTGWNDFNVVF